MDTRILLTPEEYRRAPFDAPIVYAGIEALRVQKPRVLYIMLGEGDEWAHAGRYDLYLDSAFRADRFIQRVWDTLQSLPNASTVPLLCRVCQRSVGVGSFAS